MGYSVVWEKTSLRVDYHPAVGNRSGGMTFAFNDSHNKGASIVLSPLELSRVLMVFRGEKDAITAGSESAKKLDVIYETEYTKPEGAGEQGYKVGLLCPSAYYLIRLSAGEAYLLARIIEGLLPSMVYGTW